MFLMLRGDLHSLLFTYSILGRAFTFSVWCDVGDDTVVILPLYLLMPTFLVVMLRYSVGDWWLMPVHWLHSCCSFMLIFPDTVFISVHTCAFWYYNAFSAFCYCDVFCVPLITDTRTHLYWHFLPLTDVFKCYGETFCPDGIWFIDIHLHSLFISVLISPTLPTTDTIFCCFIRCILFEIRTCCLTFYPMIHSTRHYSGEIRRMTVLFYVTVTIWWWWLVSCSVTVIDVTVFTIC